MLESFLINYSPIGVSVAAFIVSIWTFSRKQKSDEFRIALDIHNRLEKIVNEAYRVPEGAQRNSKILEYLNTWEFFAFLVKSDELGNENIHDFFKPRFVKEVKETFLVYQKIEEDKKAFKQVRHLLEEWEKDVPIDDLSSLSTPSKTHTIGSPIRFENR